MKFPPYGRGGRFSILLSQRVIVILYSSSLTFLHMYVGSSTTVALFLEAYNPFLVAAIMASIALIHIYGAIMMFLPYNILTKKIDAFIEGRRQLSGKQISTEKKPRERLLQKVTTAVDIWDAYFSDNGVLGRRGRYFELRLLGREAIEIPCQTFQAVIMSQKIPNPIVIKLYIWVIIIDCILVPLLMGVKYVKSLKRRNLVVLLDSFVDLMLGVILPASVCAMPIVQYFQNPIITTNRSFTGELISTAQFVIVTSFVDLVATVVPLLFMHFLITTAHENWTDIEANVNALQSTREDINHANEVRTTSIVPLSAVKVSTSKNQIQVSTQNWRKYWIFAKAVMGIASILWGFGLLLLLARSGQIGNRQCEDITSCVTPLQPLVGDKQSESEWSTCPCLVVDLNCNTQSIKLEEELLKLNPMYPVAMDLASCTNVTSLPKTLESFKTLVFLQLHEFHGITNMSFEFSSLSRLLALRISSFSGLTKIPQTLKNLPKTLNIIRLSDMEQLKVVPKWVGSHWKQLTRLYLERIGLPGFPTPILDLEKLAIMSLNGNPNVSTIPPQVENFKALEVLSLTNTNISTLPSAVWDLEKLRSVSVGHNNIATLEELGGSAELLNRILKWPSSHKNLITLTGNPICQTYTNELSAHPDACASECSPTCAPRLELDYKCDPECNTESCDFDRGFCKI